MLAQIHAPFSLVTRSNPPHKAQCYMMGMVDNKKEFVTNVTNCMSGDYTKIMQLLLIEAWEGRFAIKSDAIKRRDELLKTFAEDAGQDVN